MAEGTVEQLAVRLQMEVGALLKHLSAAGLNKQSTDSLSSEERQVLLHHLGAQDVNRITLQRKTVGEQEVTGAGGKKAVKVTVVRKHRYVKRQPVLPEAQTGPEGGSKESVVSSDIPSHTQGPVVDAAGSGVPEMPSQASEPEEQNAVATPNVNPVSQEHALSKQDTPSKSKGAVDRTQARPKKGKKKETQETGYRSETRRHEPRRSGEKEAWRAQDVPLLKRMRAGRIKAGGQQAHGFERPVAPVVREVALPESIKVSDLAQQMALKAREVIKTLKHLGINTHADDVLDRDTATLAVEALGHTYREVSDTRLEDALAERFAEHNKSVEWAVRAPIVTIMGHVDHGKTSLLDHIRSTRVTQGEAGGITQHVGAYRVQTSKGDITFLDTPGHAAFTAMRARGAHCTDVVILVVAADDGVMPQTIEAIQHAQAAQVAIVVAINKMDKPGADPGKIKQELSQHGLVPEAWGGDIQCIEVSAHTGQGVDEMLDAVLLQAELLELKAPHVGPAKGIVVEARLDKGQGVVATLLVQSGALEKGQVMIAGTSTGKVRQMRDGATGEVLDRVVPAMPVEILGLSDVPKAGDAFCVMPSERSARELADARMQNARQEQQNKANLSRLDELMAQVDAGEVATLHIVIKADVQGTLEALLHALEQIDTQEVKLKVVGSGVGHINPSDVSLAVSTQALLFGFHVRADNVAKKAAERDKLQIRYHSIIYELLDDVKQALSGLLTPKVTETIIGAAQVRDVFRSSKFGAIAGCMVVEGIIKRNQPIRVLRDHVVIYEGYLSSLRRLKEDVQEVRHGTECGIGVKNYQDVRVGDKIEVYDRTTVERKVV